MIFTNIINSVLGLLTGLVNLLPNVSAQDTEVIEKMSSAAGNIRAFFESQNYWFPVDDLFLIMTIIILMQVVITGFKVARWIASNLTAGFLK